jgi:cytochrome c oxidase subunit 4
MVDETATKKHEVSTIGYVATFVGLLVLATLSLLLSFLHWPVGDLIVSLVIAGIKAVLVIYFFMHMIEQPFSSHMTMLVSLCWVALLVVLATADVVTRHTFPVRPEPTEGERFYVR